MRGVYTGGEHCGVKFVLTRSGTAECGGEGREVVTCRGV